MATWSSESKWNLIYFLSAGWGVSFWYAIFHDHFHAVGMTVLMAILKESGDEMYRGGWFGKQKSTHWFWDVRGFCGMDIVYAILGCILMIIIGGL